MADKLKNLRDEYAELSKRLSRAAILTLAVLFVTVLVYARAFRRVDGQEVEGRLEKIVALGGPTEEFSYVFVPKWLKVPESTGSSHDHSDADRAKAKEAQAELETLASKWFTITVPLLGANIEIDLRYWIGFIPLLLIGSTIYLSVTRSKLAVVRRVAVSRAGPSATALDLLLFRGPRTPYERNPSTLASAAYALAVLGLLIYLIASAWVLVGNSLDLNLCAFVFLVIYYFAALAWRIRVTLEREADEIIGAAGTPIVPLRVYRWLVKTGGRVTALAARVPRWLVTIGATMIVVSPLTMMARACSSSTKQGFTPRTGIDLLRGDAMWFTADNIFPESMIPSLGRVSYAATLLLAAAALIAVLLSFFARRFAWQKDARWLRGPLLVAFMFMLVETAFVHALGDSFVVGDPIRIVLLVLPAALWLRRRALWKERYRPRMIVLLLPSLVLAPAALIHCWRAGLTGIPLYFTGLLVAALAVWQPAGEPVREPLPQAELQPA